jgi:hypothetical protein
MNDETRTVQVWLANGEEYVYHEAVATVTKAGKENRADALRDFVNFQIPWRLSGLLKELLSDALDKVDWEATAADLLDE